MNGKRNFHKRVNPSDRRSNRNVLRNSKEFTSRCDSLGQSENLVEGKSIQTNDGFSCVGLEMGQNKFTEKCSGETSRLLGHGSFNFNSQNFRNGKTNIDTKFECKTISGKLKDINEEKNREVITPVPQPSRKLRHLPFRTALSQESITNLSKKISVLKGEVTDSGHSSKQTITNKSINMDSEGASSSTSKKKSTSIILPKEQFQVLQERIKNEIENLKFLDNDETSSNNQNEIKCDSDDDIDLNDLGSDVQFLPPDKRKKFLMKYGNKTDCDKNNESKSLKTVKMDKVENIKPDVEIITIDLTKDTTLSEGTEKTDVAYESDYPSLDLEYGSKIDWEDESKFVETKHSLLTNEKPIINLDIDQSKLTVETTQKITDIKNRLSRSLSIGLSHKEIDKETSSKIKMGTNMSNSSNDNSKGSSHEGGEESVDDAETLALASLRCTSERTEVVADRERRRKRRCSDYPGLAFGFSIFSSDTMMKFNIIRNELHNIMNTQLKRVCTTFLFFN